MKRRVRMSYDSIVIYVLELFGMMLAMYAMIVTRKCCLDEKGREGKVVLMRGYNPSAVKRKLNYKGDKDYVRGRVSGEDTQRT